MIAVPVVQYPNILRPDVCAQNLCDTGSNFTLKTGSGTFAITAAGQTNPTTDLRAIGFFSNGNITPGTSLGDPNHPTAMFSGGIGIPMGICLTTGFLTDDEQSSPRGFSKVGVEGANDGQPIDTPDLNPGEISKILQESTAYGDDDFHFAHPTLPLGGDPSALKFEINTTSPGFLRVSFVFASDEYPAYILQEFNDSIAIFVKSDCDIAPGKNIATFVKTGTTIPFSLHDLADSLNGPGLFLKNQMSPAALDAHPNSAHKIQDPPNYQIYYDHEFGGFSKVLTRETSRPLAPGHYTIKFVIQDVNDQKVDSALFIPSGGLKLYSLNPGDYNGDGVVNSADYVVWRNNLNKTPADFYDGDGNGDCIVNSSDYSVWIQHFGEMGNADFPADFNRDGCVDELDHAILQQYSGTLLQCASRFEGDANGDGAVNSQDDAIWQSESGSCSGGNSPHMAAQMTANGAKTLSPTDIPKSPDVNGDGVVDEKDLAVLDQIILGTDIAHYVGPGARPAPIAKQTPQPEPTLADPASIGHSR